MMTAAQIMTSDIVTVGPDTSVQEATDLLLDNEISGLPVTDAERQLVGVISEFALLATVYDSQVQCETVAQHMTKDVMTVDVDDPISYVADLFIMHRIRRLPVMNNGRLVGVIARRDVLRVLQDAKRGVRTVSEQDSRCRIPAPIGSVLPHDMVSSG
jgi:CBS domain-containing protein